MGPPNQMTPQMFQLKAKAIEYYQNNGVPLTMENVLNEMFYDNPPDVFGYLTNYYEHLSTPPQLKCLVLEEDLDMTGNVGLFVEILCTYRNDVESFGKLRYSFDSLDAEEVSQAKTFLQSKLSHPLLTHCADTLLDQRKVDATLSEVVDNLEKEQKAMLEEAQRAEHTEEPPEANKATENPKKGAAADKTKSPVKSPKGKKGKEVVIVPDEAKETLYPGSSALTAISLGVLLAAAKISKLPLYRYVERTFLLAAPSEAEYTARYQIPSSSSPDVEGTANVAEIELLPSGETGENATTTEGETETPAGPPKPPRTYGRRVPCIMVPILAGGKVYPGKQNCVKEYLLVSAPNHCETPEKIIQQIFSVSKQIGDNLAKKGGIVATFRNQSGCLCPLLDRPEQGVDLIKDALNQLGLMEKFHVVLSLASYEIFDYEKGKYDLITGAAKSPDELVDFYADIVHKSNLIVGLIDPIRKEDREQWDRLAQKVSEKCFIFSERSSLRAGQLIKPENEVNLTSASSSGWVFHLEGRNTVSEIADAVARMRDAGNVCIASVNSRDTMDSILVDLAFGLKLDVLRLGSLSQGENFAKILRWKEITTDFQREGLYGKLQDPQQESPEQESDNQPTEEGETPSTGQLQSGDYEKWPFHQITPPPIKVEEHADSPQEVESPKEHKQKKN